MGLLTSIWRRITYTKALEDSSGKMETAFFESVYRVTYIAGFSSSDHSFFYQLYSNTVKLMIGLFMASASWYMTSFPSLDIVIEQLNVLLIQVMAVFRYKYMRAHQERYQKLATSMQLSNLDVSTPARKALVKFWIHKNETYLKLLLGLGSLTLAVWYVYPLVDDLEYNLTVNVRLPVDYRTPARYPVAYLTTLIAFSYQAYFIMVNDVIMQAHLIHLICQYTVLADCFQNILVDCEKEFKGLSRNEFIYNREFREAYISRLGLLTDQHKQLLLNPLSWATVWTFMNKGVGLLRQSENIISALYSSGWERGAASMTGVRARLLLVATRASKPIVLTAGGICDLSLNSYADLVKTSYSALTVLLRLRHD